MTIISRGVVRPAPVRIASVSGRRYADRTPDDTSNQRQLIEDIVFASPDTPAMVYSRHDRAPHKLKVWALLQESTSSRFAYPASRWLRTASTNAVSISGMYL